MNQEQLICAMNPDKNNLVEIVARMLCDEGISPTDSAITNKISQLTYREIALILGFA